MSALALDAGLGVLVATDAGSGSGLAWSGAAVSFALLVASLGLDSDAPTLATLAVLGLLLLLRRDARLVVAPVYGAALVVLAELARTSRELGRLELAAAGALRARLAAVSSPSPASARAPRPSPPSRSPARPAGR